MTTKPHDALFKATFETPEHASGIFRALLPLAVVDAIDWATMVRESGSFIDPGLADYHSDLLFSARLYGDGQDFVYLLLEHQSSNDLDMPLRLLAYLLRIWEQIRKEHPRTPLAPIIPAVLSHVHGGWTAPQRFEDLFPLTAIAGLANLVPRFSFFVEDLTQLSNDAIKTRQLAAFPKLVLWVLRDARDPDRFLSNLDQWEETFHAATRGHGRQAFAQLISYIAVVGNDQQVEEFRAKLHEHDPETEEAAMSTIGEQWLRQVDEAHEKGLVEGLRSGQRKTLRKVLALKFGAIDAEHDAEIEAATPDELDRYLERVMTVTSLPAVFLK